MSRPVKLLLGVWSLLASFLLVPIACHRIEPYEA